MTTAVPRRSTAGARARAKAEETEEQEACVTGNQAPAIFSLTCTGVSAHVSVPPDLPTILDEAQSRLLFWDRATAHAAAVRTMQDFP